MRAGNVVRDAARDLPLAYDMWLDEEDRRLAGHSSVHPDEAAPTFAILLVGTEEAAEGMVDRSRRSVEAQTYSAWSFYPSSVTDFRSGATTVDGDYVLLLHVGDRLPRSALFRLAEQIVEDRPALLYGDDDRPSLRGKERQPWFKPAWNEEMFLALDYLSPALAVRRDIFDRVSERAAPDLPFDAFLVDLVMAASPEIVHVPAILNHAGAPPLPRPERLSAVARHLGDRARCLPGPFDTVHVHWPLPDPLPLVSIIVPTRDKVDLLRACLESVFEKTAYQPYEIIVVDNGSSEASTFRYFDELASRPNVKLIHSAAAYNFSALNNLAARQAQGSFLLLLNNDTEVISPEWLDEMMRYACREDGGAVGAKLLYEDGSIQHAGVVVGMGEAAGHAHRFQAPDDPGYFWQAHVPHFVSAVTAACLLVRRDKYEAVGGLDEEGLPIAYNDVDLCLKLERAGWRNVYTPHALLYHHESKSRGNDLSVEHLDRYMRELRIFQERWGARTYADPLHNPNLDRYSERYSINLRR
ncbi:glycosyltransferase family 2 protein [Sphingomonas glaciei]|uniref:Glycosyltransferase family 2 protein n=1 Tax=Sphingomonas glaciei TaxID=2938948 RepID=A0ABY5MUC5_9SPHN|nr:glycosyltransferase family 2 protein [Sphingomonas glaciei]UUR08094.1 glycosyltransferase family 2 protein [Sphingomonas glaciei]